MKSLILKKVNKDNFLINSRNNQIFITLPRRKFGDKGVPDKIKVVGFWDK